MEADKGTISDADGNFRIDIPQSGRYTINTSYIGYEPNVMKEVLVAGVKEVVVDIQLRENKSELAERRAIDHKEGISLPNFFYRLDF